MPDARNHARTLDMFVRLIAVRSEHNPVLSKCAQRHAYRLCHTLRPISPEPLSAIGNNVNASRRLLTSVKIEQRANQIVQGIREFVKKAEAQIRQEDLPQVIEENPADAGDRQAG